MKNYFIGLDLGTSAAKGILLSESGELIAEEKLPTEYKRGEHGEVTFDPDVFYSKVAHIIRALVSKCPSDGTVAGLGISSASGNTMFIGEDGKPLTDAFSWLDTRMTTEAEQVYGKLDPEAVRNISGWPYIPSFPLAHLAWTKVHAPSIIERAKMICMSTDYINYRLTGKWAIDPSTATTFYLADQTTGKWQKPLLDALGITEDKLPKLMPTGTPIGHITETAAKETGLTEKCIVVLGAFDHPTGARGAGVIKEGQLLISCGTSWVCFVPLNDRSKIIKERLLCDPFLSSDGGPWAGMFSLEAVNTKISAYIKKWLGKDCNYVQLDAYARQAEAGAGGLRINPMTDLDRDLSGYDKKNICRALMEGTAYLLAEEIRRLDKEGIHITSAVMIGGPSKSDPWPQIVTDMLGISVNTVYGVCAGAVGAAILSGIATGAYKSLEDAYARMIPEKIERTPTENSEFYKTFKM